jgi:hypothetical protein
MVTRKRRKPADKSSKGSASKSASKLPDTARVSSKSVKNKPRRRSRFDTPTRSTAQISIGSGEKTVDPLVAWWTGLTPAERDQIGLRLLLKMRELTHVLGHLHDDFRAVIPFFDQRPPHIIPPEEPKG